MSDATYYLAQAALTWAALHAGHVVGDYIVQRHRWALTKGQPDPSGRAACAVHVGSLIATQMVALAVVAVATQQPYAPIALVLGLGINAWSHYWADRRTPFRSLMVALGKREYYSTPVGAAALDQSWHVGWLLPVALIVTAPSLGQAVALTVLAGAVMVVAIVLSRWQHAQALPGLVPGLLAARAVTRRAASSTSSAPPGTRAVTPWCRCGSTGALARSTPTRCAPTTR